MVSDAFPILVERYICLVCESEIRAEHIHRRIKRTSRFQPTTRIVLACCANCHSSFEVEQVLTAGQWSNIGDVRRVVDDPPSPPACPRASVPSSLRR
jgi:hypothetical protein